jgi:hypothetical protein
MDTAKTGARIGGLFLLIASTLVDPTSYTLVTRADIQVIIAAAIIFLIVFVDHIFGFIVGLAVLVLYSRVFMKKYGISGFSWPFGSSGYPMDPLITDYITPQNLEDAQSNVFEKSEYDKAYTGVNGVYGEAVYSAQGLDGELPGISEPVGGGQPFDAASA